VNNRELKTIIKLFESSKLSHMVLEKENVKIELHKETASRQQSVDNPSVNIERPRPDDKKEETDKPAFDPVCAPLVGTYYEAPAPDQPPFVREGQTVKEGDTLCIIEAMKVMNEISAPRDGRIVKIHAKNGDMVMYDQTIMEIE